MTDLFSQADSPASPGPSPGSAEARRMTVTSGRKWLGLLQTRDLSGSLARTCRALLTRPWASTECFLTWKAQATPQGRSVFRLVPSTPRTGGNDSGLWPTANAQNFEVQDVNRLLERRDEAQKRHGNGNGFGLTLTQRVKVDAAMWPTVKATEIQSGQNCQGGTSLTTCVQTIWATPSAQDHRSPKASHDTLERNARPLNEQAGATRSGSSAPTDSPGALNPEFVCWLMGYPSGWLD